MTNTAFKTANRVDDQLFISGYMIAANPRFVKEMGITSIVKMFADDRSYPGGYHRHAKVRYFVAEADDVPDYDIQNDARAGALFVHQAISKGERVLVHCHAGISRSATVVILYLMTYRGYNLKTALRHLRQVRPVVNPNSGFMKFLGGADGAQKEGLRD